MDLTSKIYDSVRDSNEPREMKHWHGSQIAQCPRAHYFSRLGIKPLEEVGAGKMLRWRVGHLVEEEIRIHLEGMFLFEKFGAEFSKDFKSNARFTDEKLDLTGEVDNIVDKTVIEIKSVHPFAMKWIKRDGVPYLAHEYQQHAYSLLTPIEKIIYVYVALDGWIETFETEVKPDILGNVRKRLEILNHAWKTKTPPECLCMKDGKFNKDHPLYKGQMAFCDYKTADDCCNLELLNKEE